MKKYGAVFLALVFLAMLLAGCGGGGSSSGGGNDTTLSSAKAITAFSFTSPAVTGTINETAKTISVTVPFGTNVTALVATFATTGVSVKVGSTVQVSGTTPNDYTNPVSYVETAADNSTATYTVTVTVASSSAKAITAFSFTSPAATGTINETAKTISVTVPFGTNVTALVATFATTGVSVKVGSTVQVSGTTPNDYTNPVSYVVTAADSSTATYTVTVIVASLSSVKAQWAQTVKAGNGNSIFNGVSTASDGSVYAAGYIYGADTYDFGNSVTTKGTFTTGNNVVLVKYNGSGVAQWAQTVKAGNGNSIFNGVSTASDGSVYAAGYISGAGTYDFGNSVTATGTYNSGNDPYNIVLVKYDSSGVAQWAKTVISGSGPSQFYSVSVASDGCVYAAGDIYGAGTYDFGNGIIAEGAYSGYSIVLVKYDSSGVAQWVQTLTAGSGNSLFYSVSVASDGSVYAAGIISGTGTYDFGNSVTAAGTNPNNNNYNIILVKFDSSGVAQWAKTVAAGNNDSLFTSVSVASDGSAVYAAGVISGTGPFNFGNGVTAAGTNLNYSIILVKYDSSNGAAQWARTVIASGNSILYGISVASDGSVYAAGVIFGTGPFNFGDSVITAGIYSGYNIVLVKYDSSGAVQWAQTLMSGSNSSQFYSVSVASDGSVYAAGLIGGTGPFNFGNSVTAAGTNLNDNIVLVKYY